MITAAARSANRDDNTIMRTGDTPDRAREVGSAASDRRMPPPPARNQPPIEQVAGRRRAHAVSRVEGLSGLDGFWRFGAPFVGAASRPQPAQLCRDRGVIGNDRHHDFSNSALQRSASEAAMRSRSGGGFRAGLLLAARRVSVELAAYPQRGESRTGGQRAAQQGRLSAAVKCRPLSPLVRIRIFRCPTQSRARC